MDDVLKELRKKYGNSIIYSMKDFIPDDNVSFLSTGSLILDTDLGGGITCGRLAELSGREGSGKTSVALKVCANAQRKGLKVAYIDMENAVDMHYAQRSGVVLDDTFYLSQPSYAEESFDIADALIHSGEFGVLIMDSIPALATSAELEGGIDEKQVAELPRLLNKFLRKNIYEMRDGNTTVIMTNQVRDKIGFMQHGVTTPGGHGLKHYASTRIEFRNIGEVKLKNEIIGSKITYDIRKNKTNVPFRSGEFQIWGDRGVCLENDLIELCLSTGIIKKAGSWLTFNGDTLAQGQATLVEDLTKNEDLRNSLIAALDKREDM
jgi:recombination protein RecA